MEDEAHCADCGRCFLGESKEELCEECLRCADCVDNGVCDYCNKCDACADTDHCVECHAHVLSGCCVKCGKCYECADGFICDTCEHCESCAEEEGLHCEFCGGCLEDIDPCPAHEYDSHCKYCVDYCEGCGQCSYDGDIDGLCADCGFCYECCAENSVANGCSTGDVCVESSDWDEHLCPGCGECLYETSCCGCKNYIHKVLFDPEEGKEGYFNPSSNREIVDGKNIKLVDKCPICGEKGKKFDEEDYKKLISLDKVNVDRFPQKQYIVNSRIMKML